MKGFKEFKLQIKKFKDANNILIYQMGKVGSTSIESSVKDSLHFHTLYNRKSCKFYAEASLKSPFKKLKSYFINSLKRICLANRRKVKIITIVRNPYARNISHFFQDLQFWLPYYSLNSRDFREEKPDLIVDCFEETYNFEYAQNWFNEELTRFSGIKIEECNFDKERGFGVVKKGKFEVLFLTMEKMDSLEKEISEFLGREIKLVRQNSGGKKWYNLLYKEFKANYQPSSKVIEKSFGADWVSKFYTIEDIEKMKNKALNINHE